MLNSICSGDQLRVCLQGEIDHFAALQLRRELDNAIREEKIRKLYLDFTDVSFIDSSGIGMIIGRYKTMMAKGGEMSASGLSEGVNRLYHIAGLHRIIPIVEQQGGQYGKE